MTPGWGNFSHRTIILGNLQQGDATSVSGDIDFQQCGILTSVDSDEPVHPTFKLINSK